VAVTRLAWCTAALDPASKVIQNYINIFQHSIKLKELDYIYIYYLNFKLVNYYVRKYKKFGFQPSQEKIYIMLLFLIFR